MATVLVIGKSDVVDDACDGSVEKLLVSLEHMLDILVHDWHQFNALLLDKRVASRIRCQHHHFLDNNWSLALQIPPKHSLAKDSQAILTNSLMISEAVAL